VCGFRLHILAVTRYNDGMSKRSDFTFFHPLRVRWAECDAQGIVFNVNYFLYFDVGMTEYFRNLGFEGEGMFDFFTAHAEADYRAPARFDEQIEIGGRCARLGRTSMTMEMIIVRDGEILTEGAMVYVCADPQSRAAKVLPQQMIDRISAFETVSPIIKAIA